MHTPDSPWSVEQVSTAIRIIYANNQNTGTRIVPAFTATHIVASAWSVSSRIRWRSDRNSAGIPTNIQLAIGHTPHAGAFRGSEDVRISQIVRLPKPRVTAERNTTVPRAVQSTKLDTNALAISVMMSNVLDRWRLVRTGDGRARPISNKQPAITP